VAAFWDVLPTLCEIGKAAVPEDIDGISFAPTLFDEVGQREHDYLYWEFPAYGQQQAVRAGDWKAVRNNVDRGDSRFELYNLSSDVAEERDLAAEHPDVVRRLAEIAAAAHTSSKVFPLLPGESRSLLPEGTSTNVR
jgi:arylsulfatase